MPSKYWKERWNRCSISKQNILTTEHAFLEARCPKRAFPDRANYAANARAKLTWSGCKLGISSSNPFLSKAGTILTTPYASRFALGGGGEKCVCLVYSYCREVVLSSFVHRVFMSAEWSLIHSVDLTCRNYVQWLPPRMFLVWQMKNIRKIKFKEINATRQNLKTYDVRLLP